MCRVKSSDPVALVSRYHRLRSSARFLQVVAKNDVLFDAIFTASVIGNESNKDRSALRLQIEKSGRAANKLKAVNLFWILLGLLLFVLATAWPQISNASSTSSNINLSILVQIILLALAAFCAQQYKHCKMQQTGFERSLRQTFFRKEHLASKIGRLSDLLDNLSYFRRPNIPSFSRGSFPWNFPNARSLIEYYLQENKRKITETEAVIVSIQLKDAAIKHLAYLFLACAFLVLTILVVSLGVFLPSILDKLTIDSSHELLAGYQALLILGLGGLFGALSKQYAEKYRDLNEAVRVLLENPDDLYSKASQLRGELGKIDQGMIIS